jgi:hypothetical protein
MWEIEPSETNVAQLKEEPSSSAEASSEEPSLETRKAAQSKELFELCNRWVLESSMPSVAAAAVHTVVTPQRASAGRVEEFMRSHVNDEGEDTRWRTKLQRSANKLQRSAKHTQEAVERVHTMLLAEGRLRGNEAEKGAHANTKDEKPAEERTSVQPLWTSSSRRRRRMTWKSRSPTLRPRTHPRERVSRASLCA